jgi:hypothetical protein
MNDPATSGNGAHEDAARLSDFFPSLAAVPGSEGPAHGGSGAGRVRPIAHDAGGGNRPAAVAIQGHLYSWRGNKVIAVEHGELPKVVYIDPAWQWCSPAFHVKASELVPMAMRYFHNEVPT